MIIGGWSSPVGAAGSWPRRSARWSRCWSRRPSRSSSSWPRWSPGAVCACDRAPGTQAHARGKPRSSRPPTPVERHGCPANRHAVPAEGPGHPGKQGGGVPENEPGGARERAHGGSWVASTAQRGYGYRHQQLRRWWAPRVRTGLVRCWRCGVAISPDEQWHLGHVDGDRVLYRGPEHVVCNCRTNAWDRKGDPPPKVDKWWDE